MPRDEKFNDVDDFLSFRKSLHSKSSKKGDGSHNGQKQLDRESISSEASENQEASCERTNYELDRARLKNGIPLTVFYLIRGTTGIGFFIIQYELATSGIWLGLAVCLVGISTVIWGNYTLCKLANVIENENLDNYVQITSYVNLVERVGGKCNKLVKIFV